MTDVEHVLAAALQLPPSARATIAAELLDSLEIADEQDDGVETAWSDEIQKRLKEVESGAVATVPWSQVRQRFLTAANGRGKAG